MKRSLTHVPELDGLRGCAALAVFILHLFVTLIGPQYPIPASWKPVFQLVGLGSLGVDTFFVLSGFLITSLLITDRTNTAYFNNFYWKRILRIQPVYVMHLAAAWFLLPESHGYVLCSLLFITNFDWRFHVTDVGPAWTLSIEEQFYLIWPQVIRRLSLRHVYLISIAVMIGSASLRIGTSTLFGHIALRDTWYRFDGLAMGALMACQWIGEGEGETPGIRRFLRFFNSRSLLWIAVGFAGMYVIHPGTMSLAIPILGANFLIYRVIRYILLHPRSKLFAGLRTKPLVYLGAISYSLYMFHTIILTLYDNRFGVPSYAVRPFLLRAFWVTAITLLICTATRYLVELPAMRLRKYVLKRGVPIGELTTR